MITRQLNFGTLCKSQTQLQPNVGRALRLLHYEHQLFDKSPRPELAAFHHRLLNYLHQNLKLDALNLFKRHVQLGFCTIDYTAFSIVVKCCRGDLRLGTQLHALAINSGFICFKSVCNSLMNMYSKCGDFRKVLGIFVNLKNPDTVSYNTVLSGIKDGEEALDFVCQMHSSNVCFDAFSCNIALARCVDKEEFPFGVQLHSLVLKSGLDDELFVGNALITLYTKWGRVTEAERVFFAMAYTDIVSWNSMLSGYAQEGNYGLEAIVGFTTMLKTGVGFDHVSLVSALSGCVLERNWEAGRQIHSLAIKRGYGTHVTICNVLILMYAKSELIEDSRTVFKHIAEDNVVTWTTMLSMDEDNAISFFNQMRAAGIAPNLVTFVALIRAVTNNTLVTQGLLIHGLCVKMNFAKQLNVANSFVTMYSKFESMTESAKIFEEVERKDVISWNALIAGYSQNRMCKEALETFFSAMRLTQPNEYTFGSVLSAVGSYEAVSLVHGQCCHSYLIKRGFISNQIVSGALLDMYAKRGSIHESQQVFGEMAERSEVSWTAIISAHARHGDYDLVMKLFSEMKKENVMPDSITFLSVLTACGHNGMVDMGKEIFNSMVEDYSIEPSPEHYSCMIDMLGRVGRLREAEELVNQIPGRPKLSMLQSLLGACRIFGNVDIALRVTDVLLTLKPDQSGSYVLMSNMFAEKGQWEAVAKIRKGMRERGVAKEIGFSWADVGSSNDSLCMHGFYSNDMSHPQSGEIYRMAEWLGSQMKHVEEAEDKLEYM